jgi:hypothetical protein
MSNSKRIVIIDIDGTLADTAHRLHHLYPKEGGEKNWGAFFAEAKNDKPNQHMINLAEMYVETGYTVVLLTGRPSNTRSDTIWWLEKYNVLYDHLLMRLATDKRKDSIVKPETLLEFLVKNNYKVEDIEAAYEDRLHIAEEWRKLHIPVFIVGDEWRQHY